MSDEITLEKTHALLEQLAEHVMNKVASRHELEKLTEHVINNVPTRQEMDSRFNNMETRLANIESKFDAMMNGMDAQAKQLDTIRIEQAAFSHAIDRHEKRITALEEKDTGWRIRDKK
jgi:chromosome segregation ATPase